MNGDAPDNSKRGVSILRGRHVPAPFRSRAVAIVIGLELATASLSPTPPDHGSRVAIAAAAALFPVGILFRRRATRSGCAGLRRAVRVVALSLAAVAGGFVALSLPA